MNKIHCIIAFNTYRFQTLTSPNKTFELTVARCGSRPQINRVHHCNSLSVCPSLSVNCWLWTLLFITDNWILSLYVQCNGVVSISFIKRRRLFYCSSDIKKMAAYRLRAGWLRFDSWQELGIFIFVKASRLALGSTQPPIQLVQGVFSPG